MLEPPELIERIKATLRLLNAAYLEAGVRVES